MKLDEALPVDHRLSRVYRFGAGLTGVILLVFGILGFFDQVGFFSTHGSTVAGLSSNGALSVMSVVVGALLMVGAAIGGNFASWLNMILGVLFLLSGFVNLALLDTSANFLAFRMPNVLFSFVVGLMLLTFGMYGRVSGSLPHDNPYWRGRHAAQMRGETGASAEPPHEREGMNDEGQHQENQHQEDQQQEGQNREDQNQHARAGRASRERGGQPHETARSRRSSGA
jgi:hypothetical protein